jgi:putative transposase
MPFKGTCLMDERVRFCVLYESGEHSMSELCRQFGISRTLGYAVMQRWRSGGAAALAERSHAPHHCPHALDSERREAILDVRRRYPTWGGKKVKAWLESHHPEVAWPAASTMGDAFERAGLTVARRRRRYAGARTAPFAACRSANDVWSIDFKGWFRTADGARCEPLTIQDQASRYLLRAVPLARTSGGCVWAVLAAAFREFGLPQVIRSDNGAPFASVGAGGLSVLAVRLIKAGVTPERIDPASPQQNGRLERLHRTLKAETASPPAASLRAQAERLRVFRRVYNEERPHEALGLVTPASVYAASPRPWSGRLVAPQYAAGVEIRRVRRDGMIRWAAGTVYLSAALAGELVGLVETDSGLWRVHYGPVLLGDITPAGRLRRPRGVDAAGRRCRAALRAHATSVEGVNHHAG